MAIRITGMYSGLDTESIITELASAQSAKKNTLVKAQTKLSWKQDAWKALNSKIYSFYTNVLDNMRFQASYLKKTTKVSNTSALSVVAGNNAVDGTHSVKVKSLAKGAYLTGANLTTKDGVMFRGAATLDTLNKEFKGTGKYSVVGANGVSMDFEVNENTTIDDIVNQISSTGLIANYDQDNQRIFIQSSGTGALANFHLVANDENGMKALASFGLLSESDLKSSEYTKWAGYADGDAEYEKLITDEIAKRAASYKTRNDELEAENKYIDEVNQKIAENNTELLDKLRSKPGYNASETVDSIYDTIYGELKETGEVDDDGNPVLDKDGNPVKARSGGLKAAYEDAEKNLKDLQAKKEEAGSTVTDADIEAAQSAVDDAKKAYEEALDRYDTLKEIDENDKALTHNTKLRQDNVAEIKANEKYFNVDEDGKVTGTRTPGDLAAGDEDESLEAQVRADFQKKIDIAKEAGQYAADVAALGDAGSKKIDAQDAEIYVDGVKYASSNNSITINGMTLTALEETGDKEVTLTTSTDTEGIYDMIKNFFTEYNKLINEMTSLYNAESSKGYEPLLSEEKSELADSEIEEWEKKIKDSLLRRDSTLSSVSSAMKNVLLKGATVNGKQMYLADFGINTLGYFNAAENEKSAYHIDGDQDDVNTKANDDILRQMIASDPETVMQFFSSLSQNLYDELGEKMKSVKDTSSAFTVYNDKIMKKEYESYTEKIAKEEEKLNALMDKWYSKFSAMETALAKMQSKNSAVSSMFGN